MKLGPRVDELLESGRSCQGNEHLPQGSIELAPKAVFSRFAELLRLPVALR